MKTFLKILKKQQFTAIFYSFWSSKLILSMTIFSVGCMIGTPNIEANFETKTEADYCGKAYLFRDSKFSDYRTMSTNRESTKTTRDGYRLWRPF